MKNFQKLVPIITLLFGDKMIVSVLQGGLGNQMFQIACGYAYARKHKMDWAVNFRLSNCPNQGNQASVYRDNLYRKIPTTDIIPKQVYNEPNFGFSEIPKINGDCMFRGYFQSEKYFYGFQDEVREIFQFSNEVKDNVEIFIDELNKPILGIHIRRGDYVKFKNIHTNCGTDYYKKASKRIGEYSSSVICTDDWLTVSKEMSFSLAIKSPFENELEDMYFLSKCDKLVLCNSSFSWWGSFLGNASKTVVTKDWFANKSFEEYKDIYRNGWVLI